MAMQLGSLRDALIEGGTSPELASKASEEVASYEKAITDVKSELLIIKWMLATIVAGVASLVLHTFVH